jgi:hypothetical protein
MQKVSQNDNGLIETIKKPLPKGLIEYGLFKKNIPKGLTKGEVRHRWLQYRLDNKLDEYNEVSTNLTEEQKCALDAKSKKKKTSKTNGLNKLMKKTSIVEDVYVHTGINPAFNDEV